MSEPSGGTKRSVPFLWSKRKKPFLGHSIVDGKIVYSSVSQIVIFDPFIDGGCNRRWAYQYRFGKKLEKTVALKGGIDYAGEMEYYLVTGEDTLPPKLREVKRFMPAPGSDLECEMPLGDMEEAVKLRRAYLQAGYAGEADEILDRMWQAAGLVANGVPLDGAADCRHRRQTFIDGDGVLHHEHPGMRVTEINDLKMISQISTRVLPSGDVKKGWAKTQFEIANHPQWVGYGRQEICRHPETTHLRLSALYGQTSSKGAEKRTALVPAEEILRRWDRVEGIMRRMEQVATADRIEDVEPSLSSCDSYTHVGPTGKTEKGCGHRYYCPLSKIQAAQAVVNAINGPAAAGSKEMNVSLFDKLGSAPLQGGPHAPSVNVATYVQDVEEAKRRLLAEEGGTEDEEAPPPPPEIVDEAPPPPPSDPIAHGSVEMHASSCVIDLSYLVFCEEGKPPSRMKFVGAAKKGPSGGTIYVFRDEHGAQVKLEPNDKVVSVRTQPAVGVLPSDAPRVDFLTGAAPMPAAEIDKIPDPEIRRLAHEHARLHAEAAAREAASRPQKAGGKCEFGGQTLAFTTTQALKKKAACPKCGAVRPIPVKDLPEGATSFVFPGHFLPKADASATPPPVDESDDAPPPPPVEDDAPPPPPLVEASPEVPDGSGAAERIGRLGAENASLRAALAAAKAALVQVLACVERAIGT